MHRTQGVSGCVFGQQTLEPHLLAGPKRDMSIILGTKNFHQFLKVCGRVEPKTMDGGPSCWDMWEPLLAKGTLF